MMEVLRGTREVTTPFLQSATLNVTIGHQFVVSGQVGSTVANFADVSTTAKSFAQIANQQGHPRLVTMRRDAILRVTYPLGQVGENHVRDITFACERRATENPRMPNLGLHTPPPSRSQRITLKHLKVPMIRVPNDWAYALLYKDQQLIPSGHVRTDEGSFMEGWILTPAEVQYYETQAAGTVEKLTHSIFVETVGFEGTYSSYGAASFHNANPLNQDPLTYNHPVTKQPVWNNRQIVEITYKVASLEIVAMFHHTQKEPTFFAMWRGPLVDRLVVGGKLPQELDLY